VPFAVKVDSEFILVTGGYGTTSWTVKRGFGQGNGGAATATHSNAAGIGSTSTTLFDATITAYGSATPKTYMSSAYAGGVDASTYLLYRMPVRISNAENVTVRNCLIRNSVSAGVLADATSVNGCTDVLVTGCRIKNTWDNGVYFHKGVQYATAIGNLISDTMYNGVSAVYCDHILTTGNNIRSAGPSFSDSGGMQVNGSSNCDVTGNMFDRCQFYGVSVQATNETNITNGAGGNEVYASVTNVTGNMITGCHAADYPSHNSPGISFNGSIDCIVSDNTIQGCDYGISVGQKAVRTTITGNRIAQCTSLGVNVGNSADVVATVVRGNVITKNGSSGIFADAPVIAEGNIITGNVNQGIQLASVPSGLPRKTDFVIGNFIADNTDSGVLCTAAAPSLAIIEKNTFTNTQGVLFTDGVANGTTTFTSATAAFTSADVGSVLIVFNQGTGGTTTATTIVSVTNGTTVVLGASLPGTQTGLTFQIGRGPSYYADGSTTTAANSVLTSATAAFTSSDAGLLVVLMSLDPVPAVLGVTTVNSVTNATTVTLGADFGTLAACGFFINRSAGQMGKAINNFNGNPVIERDNTVYGIPEYQGAAGVQNVVQPSRPWLARRPVADHDYTLNKMDQLVAFTSLTAGRTLSLPAGFGSATLPYYVDVKDESGAAAANAITLSVTGGGTIDGAASIALKENYGQVRAYSTGSNWYSMAVQGAAPAAFRPANPASTVSATAVMMGLGSTCAFTPRGSGRVLVNVTAYASSTTAAAGINCGGRYGTGTAPANGVAATGTQFGSASDAGARPSGTGSNAGTAFAFTDILTLTPGTAYWLDLALLTTNVADAASLTNISMTLVELP
jgi:parallel beta-helix repeat protein